jgi:hypothetical protein
MSRVFYGLEKTPQDRTENDPPLLHHLAESPAETAAQSATGIPTGPLPATTAAPPIPDYAISSRAGPTSKQPAHAVPTAPAAWPVRVWFFSLLSLIGLALLTLALPAQHGLLSPRRLDSRPGARPQAAASPPSSTARATPPAAPSGAAPEASPAPAAPAPAIQREPRPTRPAPSAHTMPLPGHVQRNTANCSEAMLAMNLCTTPSP